MTRQFTVHEARPTPGPGPKVPAGAAAKAAQSDTAQNTGEAHKAKETGGPSGPEPTRYGDWERKGICVDF